MIRNVTYITLRTCPEHGGDLQEFVARKIISIHIPTRIPPQSHPSSHQRLAFVPLFGATPVVQLPRSCLVYQCSRRYPPADGWTSSAIMLLLLSVGFALGRTMIGEVWSWFLEGYRVGNAHMSYRAQRLIWSRNPTALFSGALVLFWLIAVEVARRAKSTSTPGNVA